MLFVGKFLRQSEHRVTSTRLVVLVVQHRSYYQDECRDTIDVLL